MRTHEDPSLHAGCEVRRDHVARVSRDIARLQKAGAAADDIDPHVAAAALCAMVEGFGRHWYGRDDGAGDEVCLLEVRARHPSRGEVTPLMVTELTNSECPAPNVVSAVPQTSTSVLVNFDRNMTPLSAATVALDGGASVVAVINNTPRQAALTTTPATRRR